MMTVQPRPARLDPDSYRIIKSSKHASIIRPKQQLAFVTSMNDTEDGAIVNMDPFVNTDSMKSQDDQEDD